ncbi:hypothetical protein BpHYR1_024756 [Brachionus plicatilis]|uniref:Uncharacterized protein n=1 Tax=Brachionus plicatilis TaxID=10195 RepID=A0A3M7T5E3_BRAPC|nr:hypothetical protein BpHYR1_024756 [Brachionus plicatilis]
MLFTTFPLIRKSKILDKFLEEIKTMQMPLLLAQKHFSFKMLTFYSISLYKISNTVKNLNYSTMKE